MAKRTLLKVGSKVYTAGNGEGVVTGINLIEDYPIKVEFKDKDGCTHEETFMIDGKFLRQDAHPTLSLEPVIVASVSSPLAVAGEFIKFAFDDNMNGDSIGIKCVERLGENGYFFTDGTHLDCKRPHEILDVTQVCRYATRGV